MKIARSWAMPNKNTFGIAPIKDLLERYITPFDEVVDPFANNCEWGTITNDLDPQYKTDYHMDATDFLKMLPDQCANVVLYDPPFSPRQVMECYKKFGMSVNMETTQASYWSKQKEQIARIIKQNGTVITCGWHNDTIVTVERKVK